MRQGYWRVRPGAVFADFAAAAAFSGNGNKSI
jgi:hypothetical protein